MLGLVTAAPGTTNGAHTFRLVSSVGQLCDSTVWLCSCATATTKTSSACEPRDTSDLRLTMISCSVLRLIQWELKDSFLVDA
ncbi:hypothetical protein V6N13_145843 [Hibiscus sabdariffa]